MKKPRMKWSYKYQCWHLTGNRSTSQNETLFALHILTLHIKKGRIPKVDYLRSKTEELLKSQSHIIFSRS